MLFSQLDDRLIGIQVDGEQYLEAGKHADHGHGYAFIGEVRIGIHLRNARAEKMAQFFPDK